MSTGENYVTEPDIPFVVTRADVRAAICQDPSLCTLAQAGNRAIGSPVRVVFDDRTGEVGIGWHEELGSGRYRYHRGVLVPHAQAIRLLLLTDANRPRLLRNLKDEMFLTITDRRSQVRRATAPKSVEEKEQKNVRRNELRAQRKAGLAPPPESRSAPRISRTMRGMRGIGLIPAQED